MSIRSSSIQGKVYKYFHKENVWIKTNLTGRSFDKDFLTIATDGTIHINGNKGNGYAWDGCSPKAIRFDFIWGTPDGILDFRTEKPITYFASMIHDALYQYKHEAPLSRKEADLIFRSILRESGFRWWRIYGLGVRIGGMFYGSWMRENT